jgi:cytochrome P450
VTTRPPTDFDLADPTLLFRDDVLADPTPLYAFLRRHAPVWEIPGTSTFVVSKAELVGEAVGRPEDFSSNLTSLVYRGADGAPAVFDMAPLGAATHVLATADRPVHTPHRALLQPALSRARVAALEPAVRTMVDELLDRLLDGGEVAVIDVVAGVAEQLPMRVIMDVIGLPAADVQTLAPLVRNSDDLLAGAIDAQAIADAANAAAECAVYLAGRVEQEVRSPRNNDSLIGRLAEAVGDDFTLEDAVGILVQLLGAGTETTASLIGRSVLHLAGDNSMQQRLRMDPGAIPAFLEELLRYDGPFRFHYRTTRRATVLGGVSIPAHARLLLMWASANLDDAAVADPETFDIDRPPPNAHLAFGRGIHFCIGAHLARLEARLAIEGLLARSSRFRVDPGWTPAHASSIFLRRLETLPVTVEPV